MDQQIKGEVQMKDFVSADTLGGVTFYPAAPLRRVSESMFELARPHFRDADTLYPLMDAGAARYLVLKVPCEDIAALLRSVVHGELVMDAAGQIHGVWRVDAVKLMELFDPHPQT